MNHFTLFCNFLKFPRLYPPTRWRASVFTFVFSLFSFSLSFAVPQIYLIDPSGGGDFKSITEAIDDLYSSLPISNEIIYKISAGTYEEQLIFNGQIAGANPTNTITFVSADDDANSVNISPSAGNVIEIDNAQFVVFNKLTFTASNTVKIVNAVNSDGNLTFTENIFNASTSPDNGNYQSSIYCNPSTSGSIDNMIISSNIFNNGYTGISLFGGSDLTINNNTFNNIYKNAIELYDFTNSTINANIVNNNNSYYSFYFVNITYYEMFKNKISNDNDLGKGIYVTSNITNTAQNGQFLTTLYKPVILV
ncbi:MAG: hypothetical protein KDC88_14005 [Ignavibacteriae bacterium]|nr:hypothetical protein [Ignavibacteriota bacterium]